jgi:hypothetical protein
VNKRKTGQQWQGEETATKKMIAEIDNVVNNQFSIRWNENPHFD